MVCVIDLGAVLRHSHAHEVGGVGRPGREQHGGVAAVLRLQPAAVPQL